MSLDPSRWFVSAGGFIYDFVFSRSWRTILLAGIPLWSLFGMIVFCWAGGASDDSALASWYLKLAEAEVEEWEKNWVEVQTPAEGEAADQEAKRPKISPYADLLFRRVQELVPSQRSQFYVAVSLAQRGAMDEAREMLNEIAPEDGEGLPNAHAYLAMMMLQEMKPDELPNALPTLRHHLEQARKADRVPVELMKAGSAIYWQAAAFRRTPQQAAADRSDALKMLSSAASLEPELNLALAQRARALGNVVLEQQALPKATEYFSKALQEDPKDDLARVSLAECLKMNEDLAGAEKVLKEGLALDPTPRVRRAISDLYLAQFFGVVSSTQKLSEQSLKLLELALSLDESNPKVGEIIAWLIREGHGGNGIPEEFIERLKDLKAAGTATGVTHKLLAQSYLIREEYESALPELRQVVNKLPRDHDSINNLAFVLGEIRPEELENALVFAERAISLSLANGEPNADYYDTYGSLLLKADKTDRAITSFETAIQLAPNRIDFRERIATAYEKMGDSGMAERHKKIIADLKRKNQGAPTPTEKAASGVGDERP